MKKHIFLILILSIFLGACSGKDISTQGIEAVSYEQYITVERLIELTGVDTNTYSEEFLSDFIIKNKITEERAKKWNISEMLKNSTEVEIYDVTEELSKERETREEDLTSDIIVIAFCENRNTSISTVYCDLKSETKYIMTEGNGFRNLNECEQKVCQNNIVDQLDECGMFNWTNSNSETNIDDSQSVQLIILYDDGTKFEVSVTGIISENLPDEYDLVRSILFE